MIFSVLAVEKARKAEGGDMCGLVFMGVEVNKIRFNALNVWTAKCDFLPRQILWNMANAGGM